MAKPAPIDGVDGGTPYGLAARRALAVRLSEVRVLEERVAVRRDADGVHDIRVATRRLRAAIGLFDRGREGPLAEARVEVKRLGHALGLVRDLDVQVEWLSGVLDTGRLTDTEHAGVGRLCEQRRAGLPPHERELAKVLERWIGSVAPRLEQGFATIDGTGRMAGKRMQRKLSRRLARVGEAASEALALPDAHTAHELRILVKRLRYDCEVLEAALPLPATAILEALVPLQATLGDLHDTDVRLPLIARFLAQGAPWEQPGAIRLLKEEMRQRDHLATELCAVLARWRSTRLVEELRGSLET